MVAEQTDRAMEEVLRRVQALEAGQQRQQEQHNQLVQKLEEYAGNMAAAVKKEVDKLAEGLQDLYKKTEAAVVGLANRVQGLETNYQGNAGKDKKKSLLHMKDMLPKELTKDEEWRKWKADVEDYVEETVPGMKEQMEKAKGSEVEIDETWFGADAEGWWEKGETLWRFLRRYTGTEARRIISGVSDDNGWEAWRQLNQQYEPGTAAREAQVMARVMNMTQKKAKNPRETKALMIEMGERGKRVEDVTGRPVDERTMKSVITCFLDTETAKHTAQYQGSATSLETLRKKVMEFTNIMTANADDRMDVGRIQTWESEDEEECEEGDAYIGGFGEKCHQCGGYGHYARECPSSPKGKGKGKDGKGKGQATKGGGVKGGGKGDKGKGKGKGEATGPRFGTCWTCGGNHFARNCPQATSAKGAAKGGLNVMTLSSIRESRKRVETRNRFQALERDDEEDSGPMKDTAEPWSVVATKATRRRWGNLRTLREVVPPGVNSVEDQEWEELEMAVDSGASETVLGEDMLRSVETTEGAACRRGVQYEVANGDLVPNLGEKKFCCVGEDGKPRGITAQVCDVNKALLSVRRMVQAGNRVVFDSSGGYIEHTDTGDRIHMREQGGMYMLKLWVQRPFQGQANIE